MLYSILLFIFILDAALLMVVILLQDSKGQGLGGAFGGGSAFSTAVFGGRGAADFLSKATTFLGTSFLVLALMMTLIPPPGAGERSIVMDSGGPEQQVIPQTGLPLLPGATPFVPAAGAPDTSGVNE